jgi:hypothetical protein
MWQDGLCGHIRGRKEAIGLWDRGREDEPEEEEVTSNVATNR